MAKDADKKLITLTMDGVEAHRGHVMARALVDKFDKFLKTFGAFERVYLATRSRQTDFEVAEASHNSPIHLGLNPVPRVKNHIPGPVVNWTLDQWDKIASGQSPDARIDEDLLRDFVGLAHVDDPLEGGPLRVQYDRFIVNLDDTAAHNAEKLRFSLKAGKVTLPWRAGVTTGTIIGDLESVLNAESEREIVICPFVGPHQIRCRFTDEMREEIRARLFKTVKVTGILHYGDIGPHPFLIEIQKIEGVEVAENTLHFLDAEGLFEDGVYPIWATSEM